MACRTPCRIEDAGVSHRYYVGVLVPKATGEQSLEALQQATQSRFSP